MLSIKGATTQTFSFLTLRLDFEKNLFQRAKFFCQTFAYAKFGYRTVSNFKNTKLEKLPIVKLLKIEIFCLFCQILKFNFFQSA